MPQALRDNMSVMELLGILGETQTEASGLVALIGYVQAMERQLDAAASDLREMRHELAVMREEQNHPLHTALQKAARALETKIGAARARLGEISDGIKQGCKNAVAAFKQSGVSALANLAAFFRVEPLLQKMKQGLAEGVATGQQSMRRIEAMSAEYHRAGLHMRNMGRALRGRDAKAEAKPSGRLAKLAKSPFAVHTALLKQTLATVDKAIAGLGRLNLAAGRQAAEKPSVLHTLDTMKKRARQQSMPAQAAPKRRGVDL